VRAHVHTHAHTYIHTHTDTHTLTHSHTHTYIHIDIDTDTHVFIYADTQITFAAAAYENGIECILFRIEFFYPEWNARILYIHIYVYT